MEHKSWNIAQLWPRADATLLTWRNWNLIYLSCHTCVLFKALAQCLGPSSVGFSGEYRLPNYYVHTYINWWELGTHHHRTRSVIYFHPFRAKRKLIQFTTSTTWDGDGSYWVSSCKYPPFAGASSRAKWTRNWKRNGYFSESVLSSVGVLFFFCLFR